MNLIVKIFLITRRRTMKKRFIEFHDCKMKGTVPGYWKREIGSSASYTIDLIPRNLSGTQMKMMKKRSGIS